MKFIVNKFNNSAFAIPHDILMISVAWMLAFYFRFNLHTIPESTLDRAIEALFIILPVQILVSILLGVYKGVWGFTSVSDLEKLVKAVVVGVIFSLGVLFLVTRLELIPRSVPFIYSLLLLALFGGPRILYRWNKDRHLPSSGGQRVLIVGAGGAGEMLVREMLRNPMTQYQPIAFVDDNKRYQGREVHGIPIVSVCDNIPEVTEQLDIELVLLAIPSSSTQEMRRLVLICEESGVPFRTVPNIDELFSGRVSIGELREVSIEDILGREPVTLDWDAISSGLNGKSILITGGGGSIGSELCRQIARLGPSELILFEHSEFNLYAIEMELRRDYPEISLHVHLGDVSDYPAVERVFKMYRPDVVYHAAAYKHVPLLENQVREAVNNNIIGTRTVAINADRFGCSQFVLISTDKAVNPSNVMGASKRIAEIFCQNLNVRSDTKYITVRFGNVLGSAGSVVPLFQKQIAAGGPITVTHKDIERYFMTIPEACQLIMQASVIGAGGEIFVLNMGAPIKISFLAEQMIRLSGKEPGKDIEISYTGLRPGEKLFEELFHDSEQLEKTSHEKILLARHRVVDWEELEKLVGSMELACEQYDQEILLTLVDELVPENRIKGSANESDAKQNDSVVMGNSL